MKQIGDKYVIAHPRLRPQYLCGAVIELTRQTGMTFEAKIIEMPKGRARRFNDRFYVGGTILGVYDALLQPLPEQVAA